MRIYKQKVRKSYLKFAYVEKKLYFCALFNKMRNVALPDWVARID